VDAAVACAEEAVRRVDARASSGRLPLRCARKIIPGLVHGVIDDALDAANLNPAA